MSSLNVQFFEQFYDEASANDLLKELKNLPFEYLHVKINGKTFTPKRKVCAFADEGVIYSFSGTNVQPMPWNPTLLKIKEDVESHLDRRYNHALINFYPDGNAGIGLHQDNEQQVLEENGVTCVSLGATRTIHFSQNGKIEKSYDCTHGSMYVMLPPTNKNYFHKIDTQSNVKDERISITFRYINLPFEPPSPKKPRMDDDDEEDKEKGIPSGDWMDNFLRNGPSPCTLIQTWELGWCCYVSIILHHTHGVRIHLREFFENARGEFSASKHGVIMLPATWIEFIDKLANFNTVYKKASFISNNQLLVLSKKPYCHVQQLFFSANEQCFNLKPSFIALGALQVNKILELSTNITACVQETLLCRALPEKIMDLKNMCGQLSHCENHTAKQQFFECVYQEVMRHVNYLYECQGCIFDSFSQVNHSCLMETNQMKYSIVGQSACFHMNVNAIAAQLVKKFCTCHYCHDFFSSIQMEEFLSNLRILSEVY